ncbi:MAG: dTDP-glucose 4,6-dehydratase [Planctomycetes bacterium]|nr:dTDP-glucose 4,6-dehydratase [Planctomycetota bacterium]
MKTILVTGGAGFIGSDLVRRILAEEPDTSVLTYDLLTYAGNLDNLKSCIRDSRHRFAKGDICDRERVGELLSSGEVSHIINLAAESHVDRSILGPKGFAETNVLGTVALLEAACEAGIERFVQVSTDEVYGSLGSEGSFSEESPLAPSSPYSASKAAADHFVEAFGRTFGMDVIITRCSNNYGPFQFPEKLIPLMIRNAMNDEPLPIYGDGLQVRDWIHVGDHSRALLSVLKNGESGGIYNIGGGNERTNLDVVKSVLRVLGKPESLIRHIEDRPGHDRRYSMDASKIRAELDWQAEVEFERGIENTVQWYIDNRDWLESVITGEYRNYYSAWYSGGRTTG